LFYNIPKKYNDKNKEEAKHSPFTEEQEAWILLEYRAHRSCLQVKGKFRIHFVPYKVPYVNSFGNLGNRFITENPKQNRAAENRSVG